MKEPTILITGSSRGIGYFLALHYLERGFQVAGCSKGNATIDHPAYTHYSIDVSDEKQVVHMVRSIVKSCGRIDQLINNAGIASMNHIVSTPYATARAIFDTNFMGTFLLLREVSKNMIKHSSGRIINFTTIATPLGLEGEALYAASKAAVENFTRVAAKELAEFNITVNAVGPSPVPTDLIKNIPAAKMDVLLNRQSIKRFATLSDITNVTDFLLSEQSSFITGQIIYLGGVSG